MKKFLEVLIDDNGEFHLESEFDFSRIFNFDNLKEYEGINRSVLKAFSECIWKDRNNGPSYAVRLLSMAEIAATAEPYDMAEQFWSTMMFSYIPHYENYCDRLKKPYGFNPQLVTRPITVGDPKSFITGSIFPLGKHTS
jgi:hypothetical protein